MYKAVVLCVVSASLGALAAMAVIHSPIFEQGLVAQELVPPAAPGFPAQTVPGPSLGSPLSTPATPSTSPPSAPSLDDELTAEERVSVKVYEDVNRSVVNINTESVRNEGLFFELASKGEGSGSVISDQGHVLTNFHVVDGAREIQVTLFDGKTYEARLVGRDPTVDVAVLKIEAPRESLFPVTIGDSSRLRVGQRVYAIGNPFGLERTLSTGIISSLNRSLPSRRAHRTIKQIIQIDAAINPGNSGGPLLDSRGRMIGMNTAIASKTGESAGVGFAIPASTISRVVPQLIGHGRVTRAEIGIARVYQTEKGLLIASLVPGGPAERAGFRGPRMTTQRRRQGPFVYDYQTIDRAAADLIVAVDGQPVKTADDFLGLLDTRQPGSDVLIGVIREGKRIDLPVRLGTAEE